MSDERSEASNRFRTLEIAGNELRNSFQLLVSFEIGPFQVEFFKFEELQRNSRPYVRHKENTMDFPVFVNFNFKRTYLGAHEELEGVP